MSVRTWLERTDEPTVAVEVRLRRDDGDAAWSLSAGIALIAVKVGVALEREYPTVAETQS